jgi:hypothetical protein
MTQSPSDTAFQATFASFRLIPSRKVAQIIFEVPIEATDNALSVLGGVPNPEKTRWVGIAPIDPNAVKPKLSGSDLWRASNECAMLCKELDFWNFLNVDDEEAAKKQIYARCGMTSRRDLDAGNNAQVLWEWEAIKRKYQTWSANRIAELKRKRSW